MSIIRDEMAAIARECGLSDEAVNDVRLAISEIASNAIVHAYAGAEGGEIRVKALYENEELHIIVADDGHGMAPRVDTPGLGLGLPLVATLAERLEVIAPDDGGTEVHVVFRCPAGVRMPGG